MNNGISNINTYVKNNYMQSQIDNRQKAIDQIKENQKRSQEIKEYSENNSRLNKQKKKDEKFVNIVRKIKSGRKLSGAEMAYIAKKSPSLYGKLKRAEKAREELAMKLNRCKTKGEVLALRSSVTQAAISTDSMVTMEDEAAGYTSGSSMPLAGDVTMAVPTEISTSDIGMGAETSSPEHVSGGSGNILYNALDSEWNRFKRSKAFIQLPFRRFNNNIRVDRRV